MRGQVSSVFAPGNFQDYALVNRQRTNRISSGFSVEVSTDGSQLSYSNFDYLNQEPHYWQLPGAYQGDKVSRRVAVRTDDRWTAETLSNNMELPLKDFPRGAAGILWESPQWAVPHTPPFFLFPSPLFLHPITARRIFPFPSNAMQTAVFF